MKFESEKLSIRVADGLLYFAVISEINRVLYSDFINFLPFIDEISSNENQNFVFDETLKQLEQRDIPRKILDVYTRNVKFFEKKYSIKEGQINSLKDDTERGNFILRKILEDIEIVKRKAKDSSFKNIVFGENDTNIVECPIITQNSYKKISSVELNSDGIINNTFFTKEHSFQVKINPNDKNLFQKNIVNEADRYFFEKDYYDSVYNKKEFLDRGFHFEKFISFDFDQDEFIKEISSNEFFTLSNNGYINFETFYYSCLNLGLFLTKTQNINANNSKNIEKNIIINPTYMRSIFPKAVSGTSGETQYNLILGVVNKFIKNVKLGLRLVCRQSNFLGKTDAQYETEQKSLSNIKLSTSVLLENGTTNSRRLTRSKYVGSDTIQPTLNMTSLEYAIIKNKSYIIHGEVPNEIKDKKQFFRSSWFPTISVFYDDRNNQDASLNEKMMFTDEILQELKSKIMGTPEFKYIFKKIIPIEQISVLQKIDISTKAQDLFFQKINEIPPKPEVLIAKSIRSSLLQTNDFMLKDSKEY